MKTLLKRFLRKLGGIFVELGSKLIQVSNSREHLHIQVNAEITKIYKDLKGDHGKYLESAFAIVDKTVASVPVDSNFYADYYVLKSEVERQNSYFAPALLSVFTSITVSVVMDFAKDNPYQYIDEIAGVLLGLLLIAVIWGTHRMMFSKSYNVVYPYLLEKMEEKIKDHQAKTEKQESDGEC